jgi:cellulose synthase/poly-beta-1,6-N-acetylglucosamine synthase-like glycosyltransferase
MRPRPNQAMAFFVLSGTAIFSVLYAGYLQVTLAGWAFDFNTRLKLHIATNHFDASFLFAAFHLVASSMVVVAQNAGPWKNRVSVLPALLMVYFSATVTAASLSARSFAVLISAGVSIVLFLIVRRWLTHFNLAGHLLLSAVLLMTVSGLLWGIHFIGSLPFSAATCGLLYALVAISLILLPLGFGKVWLQAALFGRQQWERPRVPCQPAASEGQLPKVSIHVPCYAEPPEVVIETLNALSKLDYPNYEVIVIDNNTQDPELWLPVESQCKRLGEAFRFFHVDRLRGAKAGALNYILSHTAIDAEIIACVDSDYIADPDFLRRLVGFFKDSRIGFVQTSHDYRLWKERGYQKACYWEYMPTYKLLLPTLNEWSAAYTVGTMCLIRREALQRAGGWAEWCLTEDSELAIRIHALGYKSVVLADTFGRGLIPETFADYKKQRFRWTAGPVQQLKRHYRLLLSNTFGKDSPMSVQQKFFELIHCTEGIPFMLGFLTWLLAPILLLFMTRSEYSVRIPQVLWFVCFAALVSKLSLRWLESRMIGSSFKEMMFADLASRSLLHTREIASIAGFFSSKPLSWNRTNKFRALPNGWSALKSTQWETLRGVISITFGAFYIGYADLRNPTFIVLAIAFLLMSGIGYLTTPFVAVWGELDVVLHRSSEIRVSFPNHETASSIPNASVIKR